MSAALIFCSICQGANAVQDFCGRISMVTGPRSTFKTLGRTISTATKRIFKTDFIRFSVSCGVNQMLSRFCPN